MNLEARVIPEPNLEFGMGQKMDHPKDGLFLYGPVQVLGAPKIIHVGVIGTPKGIEITKEWLKTIAGAVEASDPKKLYLSSWPGFQSAMGAELDQNPIASISISSELIERAVKKGNRADAVRSAVKLYEDAIGKHLREEEAKPDVWLVIVPEFVHQYGRPEIALPKDKTHSALMSKKEAGKFLKGESLFPAMFPEEYEEAQTYLFAQNFHHQLKAQLLESGAIIQIIRETTINPMSDVDKFGNPKRSLQELAQVCWNFCTTLYFKARGQPWQLADVRGGVCYVGLIFKRDQTPAARGEACCAAQMFLNSGNGVVFRGALGPWYSDETREFHLSMSESASLMKQVIEAYTEKNGKPPAEIFIHGRHRFNDAEWNGFKSIIDSTTNLVGVRIKSSQDLRMFRPKADVPVLRGTGVKVTDHEGYLWTTGYIPRLGTYPGFETPKPLLIEICRGKGDLWTVMADILALTKVNYNACEFASGLPVTLKFADRIGEILTASPRGMKAPPLPFRYYI